MYCDVLVIGAWPAGLTAVLTAGCAGVDVILADEDFRMCDRLNIETYGIGDESGADWAPGAVAELADLPNVRLMTRTTVIGPFDHGIYGAVERMDVQDSDAAAFLNKIYCNGYAKLPVGKTRYGLMLREDGFVTDDGTAARLSDGHFVATTTTANAVGVYRQMEFVRQCLFPDADIQLISTTEAWAQFR